MINNWKFQQIFGIIMLNIDKNTKCSLNIEIFVIEYILKIKSDFIK